MSPFLNSPLASNLGTAGYTQKLGLIGDGKLARHLSYYFSLVSIPHQRWSRRLEAAQGTSWQSALQNCSTLLLAVSDRAIDDLASQISNTPGFEDRTLIHFSGSLSTSHAWGFHPLMSFSETLYPLETYERIPFVLEDWGSTKQGPEFCDIFPMLKNPSVRIPVEKKALYHAWCVMGGNFTAFLWTSLFENFSRELGIHPEIAMPYLKQVTENLFTHSHDPRSTWTGPLVRGDSRTIETHLKALEGHPYQDVYRAFLKGTHHERS